MEELLRTNDLVLISYAESLLRNAGIPVLVADENMSAVVGSVGVLPRRVLVPSGSIVEAQKLLNDFGLTAEPRAPRG